MMPSSNASSCRSVVNFIVSMVSLAGTSGVTLGCRSLNGKEAGVDFERRCFSSMAGTCGSFVAAVVFVGNGVTFGGLVVVATVVLRGGAVLAAVRSGVAPLVSRFFVPNSFFSKESKALWGLDWRF